MWVSSSPFIDELMPLSGPPCRPLDVSLITIQFLDDQKCWIKTEKYSRARSDKYTICDCIASIQHWRECFVINITPQNNTSESSSSSPGNPSTFERFVSMRCCDAAVRWPLVNVLFEVVTILAAWRSFGFRDATVSVDFFNAILPVGILDLSLPSTEDSASKEGDLSRAGLIRALRLEVGGDGVGTHLRAVAILRVLLKDR